MKPRILVFCDFYLPGFKSGGGMWTVVNLAERFADRYEFNIITRNYDSRDDHTPYATVTTGDWNRVGSAQVYYASADLINQANFARLIENTKPDLIFLNSVFCTLSVKFLMLRRRRPAIADIPLVIAPCGELSVAALALKGVKKRAFLATAKAAGLFKNVVWKASFESERSEIQQAVNRRAEIQVAPDLPPKTILPDLDIAKKPIKTPGTLKIAFASRLVRKKNLHFLLEALGPILKGTVDLELIGPLEDKGYWSECQAAIRNLPQNIRVKVVGGVTNDVLLKHLTDAHFFALPTLNENFGYVFVEALAAGCPLLISDRTPWSEVAEKGAGWVLPIGDSAKWTERLEQMLAMGAEDYQQMAVRARKLALDWLSDPANEAATAKVLAFAINEKRDSTGE